MDYHNTVVEHFNQKPYRHQEWETHELTSDNLIAELTALNPNLIIDAGCGTNPYKGKVPNVVGFDPATVYDTVDLNLSFEDVVKHNIFGKDCADAVLALGSINFGDYNRIYKQLEACVNWTKPGGFVICRARLGSAIPPEKEQENKGFISFNWTLDDAYKMTEQLSNVSMHKEPETEMAHAPHHLYKTREEAAKVKFPLCMVWWWKKHD